MKSTKLLILTVIALALMMFAHPGVSHGDVYRQVPVVINILSNSGASVVNATSVVAEVNDYFRTNNWNVRFKVEKVNQNVTMGDSGDGDLTVAEGDTVVARGRAELTNQFGGKGIKITFAKTPEVGSTTPGWSIHRNPSFVIKDRGSNSLTAQTIFHEFGHIVTLCGTYLLEGSNWSNARGHAPETNTSWGAKNFMAPSNWRDGVDVTSNQRAKVESDGVLDGLSTAVTNNPASTPAGVRRRVAYARYMRYYAQSNAYLFSDVMLRSVLAVQAMYGQLVLGGLFPMSGGLQVVYRLLFDADNEVSTGADIAGFLGIDRELRIFVLWEYGFVTFDANVICYISGTTNQLPAQPELHVAVRAHGLDDAAVSNQHVITFEVPKAMLFLTAPDVPVGLVSMDPATGGLADTGFMTYYQEFWKMLPALVLQQNSAVPGEAVPFVITGLLPNDTYNLYVEDSHISSGALLPDGTATDTFVFPSVPFDNTYYITAQDSSGNFGFNVLSAIPEPGFLLALTVMSGVVCARRLC
jgi:hypothetical protein